MILDDDKYIKDHYDDHVSVNENILSKCGLKFYHSRYSDTKDCWVYRDRDGTDITLCQLNPDREGNTYYVGDIYFPRYTDTPRLCIPDPNERCVTCIVRTLGDLKKFINGAEAAAQLRIDIKTRSDELREKLKAEGLLNVTR